MQVPLQSYGWEDAHATSAHAYLLPALLAALKEISSGRRLRILDIGCGNGYIAGCLTEAGHQIVGVDASSDGIEIARRAHPCLVFHARSLYEGLSDLAIEPFDCVVALEVIEHLYYPRRLLQESHAVLGPRGYLIASTPYHGFLKNLAISLIDGWDRHFAAAWDGGHVKFFSPRTLSAMTKEAGFRNLRIRGVGRMPLLWKSMIMVAEK